MPFSLVVVDNGSDAETRRWLENSNLPVIYLKQNHYPGYATNRGWEASLETDTEFLHRSDNDFRFRDGWTTSVMECFTERVGQVGLRTDEEERHAEFNVGGNCVIRRELWDAGLRYDETPWPEHSPGYTEDSQMSPAVRKMGYRWRRVTRPCIQPLSVEDPYDPYYRKSWTDRGILNQSLAAYGIPTDEDIRLPE